MNRAVQLGPTDRDEARPFAHVEHNAEDLRAMIIMAAHLRHLLLENAHPEITGPYQIHEMTASHGRRLRMIIAQPTALMVDTDLTVVGFFGHRRPAVLGPLHEDEHSIDAEMIAEIPNYPGVLGYCSMEVGETDYGNLVLMASADTIDHWRTSARHSFAARVVAPAMYTSVRLHNGLLPGGLMCGADPLLVRTKYYDYRSEWPWQGVREYPAV
jgi:hypothetical protein